MRWGSYRLDGIAQTIQGGNRMKTLQEAIIHCERLARSHYVKGADDFGQIANWLRELEELRAM